MIKAYHLSTGQDGHSHVIRGSVINYDTIAAESIRFEETPPHTALDWHKAPTSQYVITLAGELEFVTHGGEKFTISPGEILIALDTTGTGHKWRLINDQPWKRAYVAFEPNTMVNFRADEPK